MKRKIPYEQYNTGERHMETKNLKNAMKRINGLIGIAQKRQESGSECDKLIGRQVERNLKMAKKIIVEEIICCAACKHSRTLPEAIDENLVTYDEASGMFKEGADCVCGLLVIGMQYGSFCSFGEE